MHTTLIGLFTSYAQAEAAVLDLERAGIVGGNVEVIIDPDRDGRAEALGMKPKESSGRIARVFGKHPKPSNEVHDDSGDMPNYIGEQEFYATHVKSEGAVLVVRVSGDKLTSVAKDILTTHGSKTREGKEGVLIHENTR
jgi:hypothetical protein